MRLFLRWGVTLMLGCSSSPFVTAEAGTSGSLEAGSGSGGTAGGSGSGTTSGNASGSSTGGTAGSSGSGSTSGSSACPQGQEPCNVGQCCPSGSVCQTDKLGNKMCVEECKNGQCASPSACAPLTDQVGNPVGPYVCKPNDGQSYDGCGPALCNACATSGFSCEKAGDNSFYYCGENCNGPADCASGTCCLPQVACGFCIGFGVCSHGVCGPC